MKYSEMTPVKYLFYILFHPVTGFEEMKFNRKGSLKLANLVCLLFCAAVVVNQVLSAFIFRNGRIEDINLIWSIVGCVGLLLLFSLSNWLFCTLLDGKGKFGEIWIVSCYSMLPYAMVSIPLTLAGRFFTSDEAFFYYAMMTVLCIWSGLLLFIGTMSVHQFTIFKNIMTLIFTAIGILIVVFLLLLFFTLLHNVYVFFVTVFNEMSFRL